MKWHEEITKQLRSKHSDSLAVIRSGKRGAKKRTNRRKRRLMKKEMKNG